MAQILLEQGTLHLYGEVPQWVAFEPWHVKNVPHETRHETLHAPAHVEAAVAASLARKG
jgi:hypothetical protein